MNKKSIKIKSKKIVFAGPFVGEFGWELLWWQGWVKKVFRTRYKDCYKIACSFPGRHVFYPDADEFWALPKWFLQKPFSSRGYITDCWIHGWPKPNISTDELGDVYPNAQKIINDFKKKLPRGTEFIIPWQAREDHEYGIMGSEVPKSPTNEAPVSYRIAYSDQALEHLEPTKKGIMLFEKARGNNKDKLIAIFPRARKFRRPDKNWTKEKYEILIEKLQKKFPKYRAAIFGEPGGAFFSDGVPDRCLDLINVDPEYRMDIQCAALKQSAIAIGGQSGAIDFALASGSKAITWGLASGEKVFLTENYMRTPLTFIPFVNPSVDIIIKYVERMLGSGKVPIVFEIKKQIVSNFYKTIPDFVMKSKKLAGLRKRIIK